MDSLLAERVASVREMEMAQADRRAADAQYAQALAALKQLEAGTRVSAPFDGVVVRRHADPGADLMPGMPILDVRSSEPGAVATAVPESELEGLARRAAEVQLGDSPWMRATLLRVDGMTDPSTRTRKAYYQPAGGAPQPGAFARVRLAAAADPPGAGAVSVPTEALVRRGELSGVFVLQNGRAWLRWLKTGDERGGRTEVLAGLSPGEEIALRPAALQDGQPVKAAP